MLLFLILRCIRQVNRLEVYQQINHSHPYFNQFIINCISTPCRMFYNRVCGIHIIDLLVQISWSPMKFAELLQTRNDTAEDLSFFKVTQHVWKSQWVQISWTLTEKCGYFEQFYSFFGHTIYEINIFFKWRNRSNRTRLKTKRNVKALFLTTLSRELLISWNF